MAIISKESKAKKPKRQVGPCTICHLHDCQDTDGMYYLFRLYKALRENILHPLCESVLCETAALQEKPVNSTKACLLVSNKD